MFRRMYRWGVCGLWLTFGLTLAVRCAHAQGAMTGVVSLQPAAINGTWYEQAEYGVKRERHCVADTVLLITPGNKANQLLFVNSCKNVKHYTDDWSATVFWKKGTAPTGRLRVVTLPLLSKPLVVVALEPGSAPQWAVLGTPNRRQLWVYARTPELAAAGLDRAKAAASAQGFDAGKLKATPQPNR